MEQDVTTIDGQLTGKTVHEMRESIMKLEAAMLALPEEQKIKCETKHHFAPGLYLRELRIPKGTCLTGMVHKTEHLNILSEGDITVWTDSGMKRLTASTVLKSMPGIKRVGYAHEDSVWVTVHPNIGDITDVEKLEEMLVAKTFEEALGYLEPKMIEGDSK